MTTDMLPENLLNFKTLAIKTFLNLFINISKGKPLKRAA